MAGRKGESRHKVRAEGKKNLRPTSLSAVPSATLIISLDELIKRLCHHYIETIQLICIANQSTGFYVMATLAFNELKLCIQIRFKLFESISFISYHSKK